MNLAEFFEKTIKSIVSALYAFAYCVWRVARSPDRAPLRLWSLWKRGRLQLGPQTFQFLCCVSIAIIIALQNFDSSLGPSILRYSATGKDADVSLIRILIIASGLYIVGDIFINLATAADVPRMGKRRRIRQRVMYSYLLPAICVLAILPAPLWDAARHLLPGRKASPVMDFIWNHQWVAQLIIYLSATLIWFAAWRRKKKAGSQAPPSGSAPKYIPTRMALAVLLIPAAMLFYSAIDAPYAYYIRRADQNLSRVLPKLISPTKLTVSFIECGIEKDGSLSVATVLFNSSETVFSVDLESLALVLAQGRMPGYFDTEVVEVDAKHSQFSQTPLKPGERLMVLGPKSAAALNFRIPTPANRKKIDEAFEEWTASDLQYGYAHMSEPACFLAFNAIDLRSGSSVHVPEKGKDVNYFSALASSNGGYLIRR